MKLNRTFLADGNVLLVAGVRDEDGRLLTSRVRVLPPDAGADAAWEAFQRLYGDVPVTAITTVLGRASLN